MTNTANFNLERPTFNLTTWHTQMNQNFAIIDAVLAGIVSSVNGTRGVWMNSTAYVVGELVVDETDGVIFQVATGHTSAASPTTFSEDRVANPTYWELYSVRAANAGAWASSTSYTVNDFVVSGNIFAVAIADHISGGTFAGDSDNWLYLIDASTLVSDIETSETNAAASEAAAAASAAILDGLEHLGAWVTSTSYIVNNIVTEAGSSYICVEAHTSGVFATDLAAVKWQLLASQGASGGGTGDLLAANNLSDVDNTTTSRSNLGAAKSGANSDITSLAGLTTALSVAQGGTGGATASAARTNLGLGTAAVLNVGKNTLWIPAAAMRPTVTNGCANLQDFETTSGRPDVSHLAFDTTSDEHAQFTIAFPNSWNLGTVTFQPIWTGLVAGAGGVAWGLQAVSVANDGTLDVAYGTPQLSVDTFLAAEDMHIGPESSAITIAGSPADSHLVTFRVFRDVSDGGDTRAQDCNLIGIKLYFTVDNLNDS